jgi:hypothetical protein
MRQHAPRTATPQQIDDPIEDFPPGVSFRASPRFGVGHQMFDQVPFTVTQIRLGMVVVRSYPDDTRSYLATVDFLDML